MQNPLEKLAADIRAAKDDVEVGMLVFAFESEYHVESHIDREWELSAIANNQRESQETIVALRNQAQVNGW